MLAPGFDQDRTCTVQIAKVTRQLLSVTKIIGSGSFSVICRKDDAQIVDKNGKPVATFKRSGGLYTTLMRVRNHRFQPFARPAR